MTADVSDEDTSNANAFIETRPGRMYLKQTRI
jgi:hypothetical protein